MIGTDIVTLVLSVLAVFIVLPIHELAHGYIAYKLGDNTARDLGRLTVNPLKHLDIIGALSLIFLHFGWAKPVPVNLRNLKKPKRDFALIAIAGPISNLLLAFFSVPLWLSLRLLFINTYIKGAFLTSFLNILLNFIGIFHSINLGLAIFNLLPVPPLDGSRVLTAFLPDRANLWIIRNQNKIYIGLLVWLFLGEAFASVLLASPLAMNPIFAVVANILSLSNLLGMVSSAISDLMFSLWTLIPAFK